MDLCDWIEKLNSLSLKLNPKICKTFTERKLHGMAAPIAFDNTREVRKSQQETCDPP
jgi:hypothetical protein